MDCCAASPSAGPLLAQVLGVGLVWTTLHCAGMCGPLLAGLRLGGRGCCISALSAAGDVAAYQVGRALTLALLGALAGVAGQLALGVVQRGSVIMGFAIGFGLLLYAVLRLVSPARAGNQQPGPVARLAARVQRIAPNRPRLGAFLLGAVLGLMPCMIVAWALSLAAASGNPLLGAAIMGCLAALTIPVLTLSALVPVLVGKMRRFSASWIGPAAMLFSSAWMLIIASAAAGWIDHQALSIGAYTVMFW
jgi:sulfite exporter TauE/SafE